MTTGSKKNAPRVKPPVGRNRRGILTAWLISALIGATAAAHALMATPTRTLTPAHPPVPHSAVAGAVLQMKFDEPSGATLFRDDSGYGNHGSCGGASCPRAGVAGISGTALSFDGIDDYVKIGSPVPLALQVQNEFSLEAWIYATGYPLSDTMGTIVGCQNDRGGGGYAIHLDGRANADDRPSPPGHIHFQMGGATNANSQVPLNQWVHIVAVRRAYEDGRIYYDGVEQPSTSYPWNGTIGYIGYADGQELDVGRQSDYPNRFFRGLIDQVAIYDRALSDGEVSALYARGRGCGNGQMEPGEECDDGNLDPRNGCTKWCTICGNGVVTPYEQCDDGNRIDHDGCNVDCRLSICGDGVVDPDEECDDGNKVAGDGCDQNCTLTGCGNGIVSEGEPCDDGNTVDGDVCNSNCTLPRCGNGIVDTGEPCDDRNRVNGDGCENDCTLPRCGNGIVDAGEECDDGNLINGEGCDTNCTLPQCGNGIVDPGEECDDGNRNPFDGCTKACTMCGNGIVTPPEECDDANLINGDGCYANCTLLPRCRNGIVDAGEECDDGNEVNGDGCDVNCTQPRCGNGIVDAAEECDDFGTCIGSANAGDGCAAAHDCPGGTCTTFGGDGCAANCTTESEVTFNLVLGVPDGAGVAPGTSGAVINADIFTVPLPLSGSQALTVGNERDGQIPVVIKAGSVAFARIPIGNAGCFCPRAVAAKTCGGTVFAPDGVTPSLDCTPGFTAGASVCAGKAPCTFVHGPGNSASGVIGCHGLDGVHVSLTQDSGGVSGTARPLLLRVSGTGGPGSAVAFATTAFGGGFCGMYVCIGPPSSCTGQDVSIYGPDGEFCTDDDPQAQRGMPVTALVTTGTATGQVLNANGFDGNNIGPFSVTGAPFRCSGLDASGAALASTFTDLLRPGMDSLFTSLLVASSAVSWCLGDCDEDGTVTITEIITQVSIALGTANVSACTAGDSRYDGQITIDEIIRAVNTALSGCASSVGSP